MFRTFLFSIRAFGLFIFGRRLNVLETLTVSQLFLVGFSLEVSLEDLLGGDRDVA